MSLSAVDGRTVLLGAAIFAFWVIWVRAKFVAANRDREARINGLRLQKSIDHLEHRPQPVQVMHIFRCDCGKRIEALGLAAYVDTVRDPRCDDCREVSGS